MTARRAAPWLLGILPPVLLLALWELAAREGWINTLFYTAPTDILDRAWEDLRGGGLGRDTWTTTRRLLLGFVYGGVPGVLLGLASGLVPWLRQSIYPLASALYVIPRIAMLPLVLVAFSIGDTARIFMVAFSVFFIVYFSALSGAEQVEEVHLQTARAYGARTLRLIRDVLVPGAAPAVMSGLRVALGFALIVIIGTEYLASNDGLGARIWRSYQLFDFPGMYAGILAVTVLGVTLNFVLLAAEWALLPWRRR